MNGSKRTDTSKPEKKSAANNEILATGRFILEEVNAKESIRAFSRLPFEIYKNDPNWIPYIRQEVEAVFDPGKNVFFTHGEVSRWIMRDVSGKVVGRVAAFINRLKADTFKQPTGGMGFFECIDDQEAANLLFDQCKAWLQTRGMEAMDGPINFGENNKYWGLIMENFDLPPYYGQNYNPAYYVRLFENYGFQVYFRQFIFHRSFSGPLPELFQRRTDRLYQQGHYTVNTYDKSKAREIARHFMEIYNDAWQTHDNFKQMSEEQAFSLLKQIKPIVDEELIYFVYYDGEPIAFMVALPNINEIYKKVGDNMNLWGKLKFLFYKATSPVRTAYGVAFGVKQAYQMRGVEGMIFEALRNRVKDPAKFRYHTYIITWVGDFNPKMIRVMEALGAVRVRTMATLRKLFDENAEFERSPIIGKEKEK